MAVAAFPFWEQADSKGRRLYEERILSLKRMFRAFSSRHGTPRPRLMPHA